jgi:predicted nucleic acid-binding protein
MNGSRIFVDTNILLYFLNGDPEVIDMISDKEIFISFITELELLSFPKLMAISVRPCQCFRSNGATLKDAVK